MFLLFSAVLAVAALGSRQRRTDATRQQLLVMLKLMALQKRRGSELTPREMVFALSGLGLKGALEYEDLVAELFEDPGLARVKRIALLLSDEDTKPTALRMIGAIPALREEFEQLVKIGEMSLGGPPGLLLLSSLDLKEAESGGWLFVDGFENPSVWLLQLGRGSPGGRGTGSYIRHPQDIFQQHRAVYPLEWADWIGRGDATIQSVSAPKEDRAGYPGLVRGRSPTAAWIASEIPLSPSPIMTMGGPAGQPVVPLTDRHFAWFSTMSAPWMSQPGELMAQHVVDGLRRWNGWPRLLDSSTGDTRNFAIGPGDFLTPVGQLSNGWDVVQVNQEVFLELASRLPSGWTMTAHTELSRYRLGGSLPDWAIRPKGNQGSKQKAWFAILSDGALVGVFDLDEWGVPNVGSRLEVPPIGLSDSALSEPALGFLDNAVFPRIHRTVIEGMPVFPGGAWHSREPWLELMEEATAVAAQALPLYSPPRAAELPTVKEVQSAVRETSGSTRNLRKRHLVQRFVDSIPEALAWARAHGVPESAVKVRMSGGSGTSTYTMLEWDAAKPWLPYAHRFDRVLVGDTSRGAWIRTHVEPNHKAPMLWFTVKARPDSKWYQWFLKNSAVAHRIGRWTALEDEQNHPSWSSQPMAAFVPRYDPWDYGRVIVYEERLSEKK